jgi:bifunctional non-homologous end joining protein LigD
MENAASPDQQQPLVGVKKAKQQQKSRHRSNNPPEGVVCREDGVSDFDKPRAAVGRLGSRDAFLYAFDLLEINGTDLRRDSWEVRRAILASILRRARDGIRLSVHLAMTDGNTIFRHACTMGLEGVVAKRRDRPHRSGRSPDWIKVKNPNARLRSD